jgi:squalene synthase HpnC
VRPPPRGDVETSPRNADPWRTDARSRDPRLEQLEAAENFPVALRLLPRDLRRDLRAVYDVVRVIDDLGDEDAAGRTTPGQRTVALQRFRTDLLRVWSDDPPHGGVLATLVPTVRTRKISAEPFEQLVQANLQDQVESRYPQLDDLLAYCRLSAEPVGRIVLAVFGRLDPDTAALSDRICTGLQIIEHCQDVREDYLRGRIYLPEEDQHRFGVSRAQFESVVTPAPLRALVGFEAERAVRLLRSGEQLTGMLTGWARLAVTGYLAGGYAAAQAMRRAGWDVLAGPPRPARRDLLWHVVKIRSRRGRPG